MGIAASLACSGLSSHDRTLVVRSPLVYPLSLTSTLPQIQPPLRVVETEKTHYK